MRTNPNDALLIAHAQAAALAHALASDDPLPAHEASLAAHAITLALEELIEDASR